MVRQEMGALVDDPGYAALIGTFGPSLLDRTGSRPAARQSDAGGPSHDPHPRQMRAIPNNAILQQLGWMANSLPRHRSRGGPLAGPLPDHARATRCASAAPSAGPARRGRSDLDVLRAYIDTLDPAVWFERARRTRRDARRDELVAVATALERLDLAPDLRRLFGRLACDWLRLHSPPRIRRCRLA